MPGRRVVADAVVVGAGPNGLVAANLLADRGWSVVVCESAEVPGGAVRSAEVTAPGFVTDLFSAFYPFAAASPVMRSLDLERWGLRWARAPLAIGHPHPDGALAAVAATPAATASLLHAHSPADARAWLELTDRWHRLGPRFVRALLAPFPPVRAGAALLAGTSRHDLAWLARTAVAPVRRLGEELFEHEATRALLAGLALHADVSPESAGSGLYGWLLTGLGQQVGFPAPVGGAQALTAALVRRLEARGGQLRTGAPVRSVLVDGGRARGVQAGDAFVEARRAVLATVTPGTLYRRLLAGTPLPDHVEEGLRTWQPGTATVKVDWALDGPIPWKDGRLATAGTVHLADDVDHLSRVACDLATRTVPERPFVVLGQMTTTDPTRSPTGTESAWAYTHVAQDPPAPHDRWHDELVTGVVDAIEDEVERCAPGFRDRIVARHVQGPVELERADANLLGGDINAGTAQLHQQLVFRPWTGLARPETFVPGLYLAGASAHPGGGVHGAPGANAARAALAHDRLRRLGDGVRALTGRAPRH